LGVGFAVSSYVASLTLFERFTEVSNLLGVQRVLLGIFPLLLTTGAFTLLYVAVPNCGVKVRHGFVGALVVALSFIVVKWVFTRFIATASYEFVYGTFAAIPIFLIWLYVCWVVILFGANLVRSIPLFIANQVQREVHPSLVLLALVHALWEKQRIGAALRVQELMEAGWPLKGISSKELFAVLSRLQMVRALTENEYLLVRDLNSVSVWDVLREAPWGAPDSEDLAQPLPEVLRQHLPSPQRLKAVFERLENVAKEEFSSSVADWLHDPAWWPERAAAAP